MTNTNTANTEYRDEPQGSSFKEHLVFVALLLPTFVVLAAAAVSLARPETSTGDKPTISVAACESCAGQDGDDGP